MCRELYQEYMDFGPREIPKSKDPFWDPPEVRQGHSKAGQGRRAGENEDRVSFLLFLLLTFLFVVFVFCFCSFAVLVPPL